MQIRKSSGLKLLPKPEPSPHFQFDESAAAWKAHVEEASLLELPRELLASGYWALRLMDAAQAEGLAQQIRGCRFLTFGFLDPETEWDAFGIAAITSPGTHMMGEKFRVLSLDTDGIYDFPVFLRPSIEQFHGSPTVLPVNASAGCWGKSRQGSVGPGLLTAKHVLPVATIGAQVPLSDATFGTVVDVGPDGVDAALVKTQEAPGTTRLSVPKTVAPYTDVEFWGASSGHHVTKVTLVADTRGVVSSSLAPARVILADYGRGGDSGALVTITKRRAAVGIYLGVLTDPAGRSEGIAQHAGQATKCMGMELTV